MKNFNIIKKAFTALAPKSTVLPILECVLLMDNKLTITDLNTSIIIKDVGIDINFVQNGKAFIKACGFTENPKFQKNGEKLTISNNEEKFTFYCEDVGDFPKIEYPEVIPVGKISAQDNALIQRAVTVIGKDELRPAMMCVAIKDGFIMSTDAHCAIYEKSEFTYSKPILLGKKTVKLLKLFPATDWILSLSDQRLVLENEDIIIVQRIDDNKFPDLMAVVPKEQTVGMTVNRKDFESAINKAIFCSQSTMSSVLLDVNSRLTITSEDLYTNKAYKRQLSCGHTGDNIKIAINGRMILNLIKSIKSDELSFGMNNPDRAITINGSSLSMPLRQ